MTNFCLHCEGAITPTTPSTKCNGPCKKYCHLKCLKLGDSDMANIITEKSHWVCSKCVTASSSSSAPITAEKLEEIIRSQLMTIKLEIKQTIEDNFKIIKDRLSAVEENVRLIQDEWTEFKKSNVKMDNPLDFNTVVSEIEERKSRSTNVLLFNISESISSNSEEKFQDDLLQVNSILAPLGSFPQPKKIIRVGMPKPNVVRPLKIVYENDDIAKDVLRSNKNNNNRNHHFRPDLTKIQRDYNNSIRKEFKDKVAQGNTNVMLRYKNNMPYIVEKNISRGTHPKK
ncbi:hypothetical protein Zmor_000635 [Zophobas morio]|uniref:PHD-type domain-containing protein n=1 Tax=Zophobas morio TaxID=2755281 RepID=A0AA38MRH3_9CUCU|nr:hypothetical protein Zmor_000635 [Zophobas morio]